MLAERRKFLLVWMALVGLLLSGGLAASERPAAAAGQEATARRLAAPSCGVCNLQFNSVTTVCRADGGLNWTAVVVNNRAGCTVSDVYTASLQIHLRQQPPN